MSRRPLPVPTYRHHKQSGQAVVTLRDPQGKRRDYLLGKHDTPESRAEYEPHVLALLRVGKTPWGDIRQRQGLTVAELVARHRCHVEAYHAEAPKVIDNIRYAVRPARLLYGPLPAAEFTPLKLKTVRDEMIRSGLSRPVVNQRIGVIKRMFKWGVAEELIPATVFHALQAVGGLSRGRTTAREPEPIRPVPDAFVDAALPHVSPTIAAMLQLQRLTGGRAGELVIMRPVDLDTSGPVWLYRPSKHKGQNRGKGRVIVLGPKAKTVLGPFLPMEVSAYVFSPGPGGRAEGGQFASEAQDARATEPAESARRSAPAAAGRAVHRPRLPARHLPRLRSGRPNRPPGCRGCLRRDSWPGRLRRAGKS